MATPANTNQNWRFGVYEVDVREAELRRDGAPVKMREQSFRILVHLLEHAGEIVTREELRRVLWPSDTFVDFDHSLNTAVMKLRDALGDSRLSPSEGIVSSLLCLRWPMCRQGPPTPAMIQPRLRPARSLRRATEDRRSCSFLHLASPFWFLSPLAGSSDARSLADPCSLTGRSHLKRESFR